MFGSSEIIPDICIRQLGIIPQKLLKINIMAKFIHEHKEEAEKINALINPNSIYIMDCPNSVLKQTISKYLLLVDDLQQVAFDKNLSEVHLSELTHYYDRLEVYSRNINSIDAVYLEFRNEIRWICKNTLKIACVLDYNYENILAA